MPRRLSALTQVKRTIAAIARTERLRNAVITLDRADIIDPRQSSDLHTKISQSSGIDADTFEAAAAELTNQIRSNVINTRTFDYADVEVEDVFATAAFNGKRSR